jgi:hypothetical protein
MITATTAPAKIAADCMTDRTEITEILLKVAFNTIKQTIKQKS